MVLTRHGLTSPRRLSLPRGCHRTWMWSPRALHPPCRGQNPSAPRVPEEEGAGAGGLFMIKGLPGLTPKPRCHTAGQWLWGLMPLAQVRGPTQRPRASRLNARSSTGGQVGDGIPLSARGSSLTQTHTLHQWQLQNVLAGGA